MSNITEITSIRASAVPAVPKTITATQRLAALELARRIEDYRHHPSIITPYVLKMLDDSYRVLIELAGDAKGER